MSNSVEAEANKVLGSKFSPSPKPRNGNKVDAASRKIHSLGTLRTYKPLARDLVRLLRCVMPANKDGSVRKLRAASDLEVKVTIEVLADGCTKTTLQQYRACAEVLLGRPVPQVKAQLQVARPARTYNGAEVKRIVDFCSESVALPVTLCYAGGLRAAEIATLAPPGERKPSGHRIWSPNRFVGLQNFEIWTVIGKGGLCREVAIPTELADALRVSIVATQQLKDRGINRLIRFDVAQGQSLSQAFTYASKKAMNFSNGIHGLRHSYAQFRQIQLRRAGVGQDIANLVVSQEMGHFRPSITNAYY
jgi:integrase